MFMKKRNFCVKISALIITLVLIAAMALCVTSCGNAKSDKKTDSTTSSTQTGDVKTAEPKEVGEGETSFKFTVTYDGGKSENYIVKTDKKTVGDALLDAGLISGSDSEYGLMVDTVNGVRADFNLDKAYWAFYINGEYANTGVSATEIEAGAEYSFVYTPA